MKSLRLSAQLLIGVFFLFSATAYAQYSSSNYQSNEVFFGTGGDFTSSTNYQAQSSIGALGVGNFSSTNFQTYAGFLTPNEPFLELSINTSLVDLGTLDASITKTGTANFHVRAYIDSGYTVQSVSQPPSMTSGASHTLAAKTTLGTPSVGTEEFGINLVDNASPNIGADPSPQPSSSFATGQAAPGYNTADNFKYNAGDVIAQTSGSGWGQTDYTISYIANISLLTPAGSYSVIHDLVAVATY